MFELKQKRLNQKNILQYDIIVLFKSLRNCDRSNKVDFVFTFYVKLINIESLDLTRKVNFEVEKI